MTIAIQLVLYNGSPYLPALLQSLEKQSDRDWVLYMRDQSESEGERSRTRRIVESFNLPHLWDDAPGNFGFSGGHQRLFERHDADLVFLLNQDALLGPEYIREIRHVFEDEHIAAAAGVIFQASFKEGRWQKYDTVDSMGLMRRRTHKVEDKRSVEHKFDSTPFEVFGVSGCLPVYRREAIEETSVDRRLFDPRYFMYKEDVDVAYRLARAGWKAVTVPRAIAWHRRTFAVRTRKGQKKDARLQSYRNHLWNLLSHASWPTMRHDLWAIIPYEFSKAIFLIVTEPQVWWRAIRETHQMLPDLKQKRLFYERRIS